MPIDEMRVEGEVFTDLDESLHVVYVKHMGTEVNGNEIYHLYLSNNPDDTFAEGWGEGPACNIRDALMDLDEDQYQYVVELKSDIILDLARHNCCFTMQDCRDDIVALAYENINQAEEYPEPRIIIHYGELIEDVEALFAQRNIVLRYIN